MILCKYHGKIMRFMEWVVKIIQKFEILYFKEEFKIKSTKKLKKWAKK